MRNVSPNMRNNHGMVLVLTLWILGFLTVLALHIGLLVRQKAILVSRLENRQILQNIAESGIKKGIAVLKTVLSQKNSIKLAEIKQTLYNNPQLFGPETLDRGTLELARGEQGSDGGFYGLDVEDSRINVNTASRVELTRLMETAVELEEDQAESIANAIIAWREYGETEIQGFYSDDFYSNLEFPYQPKKDHFEILEEVHLVKGMTADIFQKVRRYLTVYGNGQVNLNLAEVPVLVSLGIPRDLGEKIVRLRRGQDGIEATGDDMVFNSPGQVLDAMIAGGDLSEEDIELLRQTLNWNAFKTSSDYYRMRSVARLDHSRETKEIVCVIEKGQKIVYWKE